MIEIPKQLQLDDLKFILIAEKSKIPIETDWTNSNNYKYNDPKLLEHLNSSGNYGVLCGAGKLVIVDIDDISIIDKMNKLFPNTLTIKTGGGKRHYYLKLEGDIDQNYIVLKNGAGELRVKNCQVVAPGSFHPSGTTYQILNDNPIQIITKKELYKLLEDYLDIGGKSAQHQIVVDKNYIDIEIIPKLKDEKTKALITKDSKSYTPEAYGFPSRSERDQRVVTSLILSGFGQYVKSIFDLYPIGDKYREHVNGDAYLKKSIENARKYSGVADDIAISLEEEINNIKNDRVLRNKLDFYLQQLAKLEKWSDIKYLTGLIAHITLISKKDLERRIEILQEGEKEDIMFSVEEIMNMSFPDIQFFIENMIPEKSLIFIQGKPGQFKSMLTLYICISMVAKKNFLDKYNTLKVPKILYYDLENEILEIKKRINFLTSGMGLTCNDIKGLHISKTFKLKNVKEELEKCKNYDIIVLDSLRRFLEGDENQSSNTNKFYIDFLKQLIEMGKTVIVILHEKKGEYENAYEGSRLEMVRGSGDIGAQADLVYALTKLMETKKLGSKNVIMDFHLSLEKNRKSIDFENLSFRVEKDNILQCTKLNFSNFGKPMTSHQRLKAKIVEFVKEKKMAKRQEIAEYIRNSTDYSDTSLTKTLAELIKNQDLTQEHYGEYKIFEESALTKKDEQGSLF